MKIEVEIKEINNGWIVEDSYFGEGTFFDNYDDAATYAKKIFTKFKKEIIF